MAAVLCHTVPTTVFSWYMLSWHVESTLPLKFTPTETYFAEMFCTPFTSGIVIWRAWFLPSATTWSRSTSWDGALFQLNYNVVLTLVVISRYEVWEVRLIVSKFALLAECSYKNASDVE